MMRFWKQRRVWAITLVRIAVRSPWQNEVAERFVASCRRDLIDHAVVVNKRHLQRLMNEYVSYYHEDRTHLGLDKKTPAGRKTLNAHIGGAITCTAKLGSLHHRYDVAA